MKYSKFRRFGSWLIGLGLGLSILTSFNSVLAQNTTQAPTETPEAQAKLPSIAGDTDSTLWLLDARGERLIALPSGASGPLSSTPQSIDLWRPGGQQFAYVSDLVIQNGWMYLNATFEDAVYKAPLAALKKLATQGQANAALELTQVDSSDPLRVDMQQHFLRSGLWLAGQERDALLDRAKRLSASGWPVSDGQVTQGHVRFEPKASSQGQLCINFTPPTPTPTPTPIASRLCQPMPTGWQVAAIYPVGLRPMTQPFSCGQRRLSSAAQWLWLEVDLVGESAHSIESHTLLLRAAFDQGQLACWDPTGHRVDAATTASLMRVFALVGKAPEMATTLLPQSAAQWRPSAVIMSGDYWPAALSPVDIPKVAANTNQDVTARAWPYALQKWTLPQDPTAQSRYSHWQKDGFFARCFPEAETCGKPLGPRYLAQALVDKTYTGLPYGWGGNDTPDAYLKRIAEGAYPGDIHTNNVISKDVAGVDCSGFITNVWQLPQRVVTTCHGGPDAWTPKAGDTTCVGAFSSRVNWQSGQSGDALLIPGHVRLVAQATEPQLAEAGRGLFVEIIESSGYCAGACHRLLPAREAGRYRMMRPHPRTNTP
jgi:hypothetical protein